MTYRQKKFLGINTSDTEIFDLLKAWAAISLAFSILLVKGSSPYSMLLTFLLAGFTVGIGFIAHELGHKVIAHKFHCWAEFRANNQMLLFAILTSLLGFLFAAPGAVVILGNVSKTANGKISAAGPLMNFILAIIFLFGLAIPIKFVASVSFYGFMINTWLGLFNLIPIGNFDGRKILHWNKVVYGIMAFIGISFLLFQQLLFYISSA